ncbi:MAG: hypothetical protein KDB02_09835 [Acidimicrobiales bacterium]|nr:hypothetical protein [Acidimicrobiales bacterium]
MTAPSHITLSAHDPGDARRPTGPLHRRQIILLATFTVLIEVLGLFHLIPTVRVGLLDLPLSVIPAFALAAGCGSRLLGRSSNRSVAVGYWVLIAGVLPALFLVYLNKGRADLWLSYVVASFSEEFIYRLAIPMILAVAFRAVGVRQTWARPAGFAFAALWFVLLPGHREQMIHVSSAIPFIAYAALAAFIVYRSGSVLPMGAAHAVSNLLTVLFWAGATTSNQRTVALTVVLVVLVLAYSRPRRLTVTDDGELLDTGTGLDVVALDLRDGNPVSATLSDGTVIVVEGAAGVLDLMSDHRDETPGSSSGSAA